MKATILVEPLGKGRPKASVVGGHAKLYTPAKTRKSEAEIVASIRDKIDLSERFPVGVPLVLWVTFYIVKPKSTAKKVKHPVTRPDLDNYLKTLLDALNKYAYPDDSQIVNIVARKAFAAPDAPPRIEFILEREDA